MKFSKTFLLQFIFLCLIQLTVFSLSTSQPCKEPTSQSHYYGLENILHKFSQQRKPQQSSPNADLNLNTIITLILCFIASSASSAGGVGGGSLFLPILTLITGLPLQLATTFSIFMVTAVTLAKVIYTFCFVDKSLINYEIALLSEPCMLLGVSIGVLCNIMFPEWLITALFAVFLATTTAKTLNSGCKIWSKETEAERARIEVEERESGMEAPLLKERGGKRSAGANSAPSPWKILVVLVMIWLCFFGLHVLIGDGNGKGVLNVKPCGVTYWLITLSQIPIAIGFTAYILYAKKKEQESASHEYTDTASAIKHNLESLPVYTFPMSAILTGVLSGLFGIGGGLLLNPVFLQIGVPPQTAAATSSLMVLFSASMSMVQYILLGMTRIEEAVMFALLCFVASIVGLVTMQRVIAKSGRVSLVVFLVCGLMALSTVVITLFGALHVWNQIANGYYMGFKQLC